MFSCTLLGAAAFGILRSLLAATAAFPPAELSAWRNLLESLFQALPVAAYATVLASMVYAFRHRVGPVLSWASIVILTALSVFGVMTGLAQMEHRFNLDTETQQARVLGVSGRIVQTGRREAVLIGDLAKGGDYALVDSGEGSLRRVALGSREAAESLGVQDAFGPAFAVPAALIGPAKQLALSAERMRSYGARAWLGRVFYAVALALLLAGVQLLARATRWPLANVMLSSLGMYALCIVENLLSDAAILKFAGGLIKQLPSGLLYPALLAGVGVVLALLEMIALISAGRSVQA